MEYYFETDDKLDRRKYAEFLKSMLENCDKYRREDSDGAYVIAIDSPWGTGKTRFAKMLRNFLENRKSDTPAESPIDPSNGFLTVYYNAWDTDFSTDALEPLIYSIINSPEFESELFELQADEEIENFKDTAKRVLRVIGLSAAHHFLGETATNVLDKCLENENESKIENYGFEKRRQIILDFRDTLSRVIAKTTKKKLVIIVDELDRCRPTFAIQTLELAKHLFAVPNLLFLFALDIEQLSCSVKTVYGNDMDSSGYLCRFFDYISRLPLPDKGNFIHSIFENRTSSFLVGDEEDFLQFIESVTETFSLSLRDTTTILQTYFMVDMVFLSSYDYIIAKMLYFILLVIKYIDPHEYSNYLCGQSNNKYKSNIERMEIKETYKNILLQQLLEIQKHKKICSSFLRLYAINGSTPESYNIKIVDIKKGEHRKKSCFFIDYKNESETVVRQEVANPSDSWGYLLFQPDFANWSTYKKLTFSEFFFRQLEMFNFALPADDTESKA